LAQPRAPRGQDGNRRSFRPGRCSADAALNWASSQGSRGGAWNVPPIKHLLGHLNIAFPTRKPGLWRHHAEPFILTCNPNQTGG
jgi:hypothetical protein